MANQYKVDPAHRRAITQKHRDNNREQYRLLWRDRAYQKRGASLQQYKELLATQHGLCAICGMPPDDPKGLFFDHDHTTGANRGLICRECNLMLGHACDDPARLEAAAAYLRRHYATALRRVA